MRGPSNPSALRFAPHITGAWQSAERHAVLGFRVSPKAGPIRYALAICIFLLVLSPRPARSQQASSTGSATPGWPMHNSAPVHGLPAAVGTTPQNPPQNNGSCLLWAVTEATANTVSAAALQIPGKARGEYEKGCGDLRGGKLESAENHLRKAVQLYPRYAEPLQAGNLVYKTARFCTASGGGARNICCRTRRLGEEHFLLESARLRMKHRVVNPHRPHRATRSD